MTKKKQSEKRSTMWTKRGKAASRDTRGQKEGQAGITAAKTCGGMSRLAIVLLCLLSLSSLSHVYESACSMSACPANTPVILTQYTTAHHITSHTCFCIALSHTCWHTAMLPFCLLHFGKAAQIYCILLYALYYLYTTATSHTDIAYI